MRGEGGIDVDPEVTRALAALRAGEPLGEGWVYGRCAVALLQVGAAEADLEPYRSALFLRSRGIHGFEAAIARERELLARHNSARLSAGLPAYDQVAGRSWAARNPAGAEPEEDVR